MVGPEILHCIRVQISRREIHAHTLVLELRELAGRLARVCQFASRRVRSRFAFYDRFHC